MMQTVEAVIDETGKVRLLETVRLKEARRALVTILEEPATKISEAAWSSDAGEHRPSQPHRWLTDGPEKEAIESVRQPGTIKNLVAKGWNGLKWGATISEFETKFPQASPKSNEWWVTGRGQETFCGLMLATQYAFNNRGELYLVAFFPSVEDRERVTPAVVNELGVPDGESTIWTMGDVAVEVKVGGIVVTMTHQKLAAP